MACFESRGRRAWGLGAARGVGRTRFAAPRRAPRAGAGNVTRSAARQRPTRAHRAPLMRESAPRGALFAPKATAALPTRRPPPRPYRAARCLVPPRGEPRRLAAERPRRASSRENVSQRARRGRRARGSARGRALLYSIHKKQCFFTPWLLRRCWQWRPTTRPWTVDAPRGDAAARTTRKYISSKRKP